MEYDPILNWNCRNADPAPEEFKRMLPLRKKQRTPVAVQSLSMDDGLNKNPRNFPSLTQRLELQESVEQKGIDAKSTYCRNAIKSMPIILKNSRESKVDINKGVIGQTFENIEIN